VGHCSLSKSTSLKLASRESVDANINHAGSSDMNQAQYKIASNSKKT
jgi:hypothetical protein